MSSDVADSFKPALQPISDALRPLLAPATHSLFEWRDYLVACPGADCLHVGDKIVTPSYPGHSLFPVRFENQLGLTTIRPYVADKPLAPPLVVEVISPKFPRLDDHVTFFGALLDDLFARAARLPFNLSAPTERSVIEALRPPTPLFVFHFVCQEAARLRAATAIVQAAPHRVLTDEPAYVSLAEAADVGPDTLIGILQHPQEWQRARGLAVSRQLKGYAPAQVWQQRAEETFDTPENRFVLAFLQALLAATESLPQQRWWPNVPETTRLHDLRHSNVSALIASGVDLKTAQERAGHADVRTTLNVYAHSNLDLQRAAAAALDEIYGADFTTGGGAEETEAGGH